MCIDGVFINIYIYVYLDINTPGFRENVRQTFGSHPPPLWAWKKGQPRQLLSFRPLKPMPSQGGCPDQWEREAHELDRFQVPWDVGNHGNIYHEMSRIADHHHGILWNHGWPVREGKVKLMENWKSKCLDSDHSFFGQVAWLQWKISWKLCWSPKIYNVPLCFWGLLFWLIFLHNSDPSWQNRILKTGRLVNAIVTIIISWCLKRAFLGKRSRIGR